MDTPSRITIKDYAPLIVIVAVLTLATAALGVRQFAETGSFQHGPLMRAFMAGFFLVFSGLKLMDIPGFARSYGNYDLLAGPVPAYGYVYPFLELALGLSYLTGFMPRETDVATVILMTFGAFGVARSLMRGSKFQCACLGAMLKVPLSKIALIEDLAMAVMAAFMLTF